MQKLTILLLGNRSNSAELGNFAKAIKRAAQADPEVMVSTQLTASQTPNIVVYANRTSDQLAQAEAACKTFGIPLLMLATGLKQHTAKVEAAGVTVIYKPNTSMHTLRFIDDVIAFNRQQDWRPAGIAEWHQASKKDVSGTAIHIAKQLAYPVDQITSVRDDAEAELLYNLPSIDSYAVHKVVFENETAAATREFSLITIGRDSYAKGAIEIAKGLMDVLSFG